MTLIASHVKDFKYTYNILYKALEYLSLEELKKISKTNFKKYPK